MNMRLFLGALCVAALCGCGGPADDTQFKPPAGWKSTPGIMGRFQMWMSGDQIVMVIKGDKNMSISDAAKSQPGVTGLQDLKRSDIRLCGSQPAQYFTARGTSNSNGKQTERAIEGIVTAVGDAGFLAMYIRPFGAAIDPQADSALHTLCKK